jgi:hypothetical protein
MQEMDACREFVRHGDQIVIRSDAVGTGAEGQPVGRPVDPVQNPPRIGCGADRDFLSKSLGGIFDPPWRSAIPQRTIAPETEHASGTGQ